MADTIALERERQDRELEQVKLERKQALWEEQLERERRDRRDRQEQQDPEQALLEEQLEREWQEQLERDRELEQVKQERDLYRRASMRLWLLKRDQEQQINSLIETVQRLEEDLLRERASECTAE